MNETEREQALRTQWEHLADVTLPQLDNWTDVSVLDSELAGLVATAVSTRGTERQDALRAIDAYRNMVDSILNESVKTYLTRWLDLASNVDRD